MHCQDQIPVKHRVQRPQRTTPGTVQSGKLVKWADRINPDMRRIEEKKSQNRGESAGGHTCKSCFFHGGFGARKSKSINMMPYPRPDSNGAWCQKQKRPQRQTGRG